MDDSTTMSSPEAAKRAAWSRLVEQLICEHCGAKPRHGKHTGIAFHHRDPAAKKFKVGTFGYLMNAAVLAEIAKCDIVCRKCHAHIHYGMRTGYLTPVSSRNKHRFAELVKELACEHCGAPGIKGSNNVLPLVFRHRKPQPGDRAVSALADGCDWDRIIAEIAKCDVLCRRCAVNRRKVRPMLEVVSQAKGQGKA